MMCISKTTPMSVGRSSSVIPNSRSSTRQYVHPATALWQGWSHRQHRFAQLRKRYRKTKLPQLPYFSAFNRQRADIVQSRRKVLLKYLHLLVMNEIAVDSVDLASFLEITRHLDGFKTMHRTSSSTLPHALAR